jgi:hypothetical protein
LGKLKSCLVQPLPISLVENIMYLSKDKIIIINSFVELVLNAERTLKKLGKNSQQNTTNACCHLEQ